MEGNIIIIIIIIIVVIIIAVFRRWLKNPSQPFKYETVADLKTQFVPRSENSLPQI
jgi:uncharacterized protein YpmB